MKFLLVTIFLLPSVLSVQFAPGPIKAFTLKQTLPQVGAYQTDTVYRDQNAQHAQDRISTTYHGNVFGNKLSSNALPGSRLLSISDDGFSESSEQTLGHSSSGDTGGSYFGNKLYNGFLGNQENCPVEKYAIESDGVVEYHASIPELEEFTLCAWMRFTNHSGDHTIFTYSAKDEPREIQLWIANSNKQSFISMAVHGQSLFRLNYPLKLFKWHHMCGSWNGKTGEWQLWVKAERVGRGFHNRLVNHAIDGHGVAYSGGQSITGAVAEGHHVEITMVQLYKIALSAGKAHRDHKHHHVHHFDHNGPIEPTTRAPPPPAQPVQPANPLLANGQILSRVPLNLAGPQNGQAQGLPVKGIPSQLVGQQQQATIASQFANGQLNVGSRFVQEQLAGGNFLQQSPSAPQQQQQFISSQTSSQLQLPFGQRIGQPSSNTFGDFNDPTSTQLIERFRASSRNTSFKRKRETENSRVLDKRALVMLKDGSLVDDSLLSVPGLFDGLTQFGVPAFKQDAVKKQNDLEEEIKEHDREPAEGEVQAVMSLCNKCQVEPFEGAIILGWRDLQTTTKDVLKGVSTGACGDF